MDDHFTRKALMSVSACVDRILQLSRLDTLRVPSAVTNGYLMEATRTYIFGFPQASVALSRATLDQALKEALGYQLNRRRVLSKDLIQEAYEKHILDSNMRSWSRGIARAGNDVMHEKPTTMEKSLEVLDKVRGVLEHIYRISSTHTISPYNS